MRSFLLISGSRSLRLTWAAVNQTEPDSFEALWPTRSTRSREFQRVLERVAVVSDLGSERHAYGEYFGDGIAANATRTGS